jgi:hypothetical protein
MRKLTLAEYLTACKQGVDDRIKSAQDPDGYTPNPPEDPQRYQAWADGWREHGLTLRRPEVRHAWSQLVAAMGRRAQ